MIFRAIRNRARRIPSSPGQLPDHVAQNMETIAALRARSEENIGKHQRVIEQITTSIGRPIVLYLAVGGVIAWTMGNVTADFAGYLPPDPPPFYWLQGLTSLSALFVTIMILTTQNRQGKHAEQRAHLDLQVNLMAEQKIAKLIDLVEELRRDLPNVRNRVDHVAAAMTEAVDPHAVFSVLEETLENGAGISVNAGAPHPSGK